jgi:hypothetical protein
MARSALLLFVGLSLAEPAGAWEPDAGALAVLRRCCVSASPMWR